MRYLRLLRPVYNVAIVTICTLLTNDRVCAQPNQVTRASVVSSLRHQEELVRSMECEWEYRREPTTPKTEAMIRGLLRSWNREKDYPAFATSKEQSDNTSFVSKYWRKGAKQRDDRYAPADDPTRTEARDVVAFDGQIVRALHPRSAEGPLGAIRTEQSAYWNMDSRTDPFTFLYLYYENSYSKLVQDASKFEATQILHDGQECTQVSIACSAKMLAGHFVVMVFDSQNRLVERQINLAEPAYPSKQPKLKQMHAFSDYRSYTDASGETIWYPHEAIYKAFMGSLPDGTLVANWVDRYKVRSITFNPEIPDEKFELSFPDNAKVYDGVTGLGWLEPGVRPAAVFPKEATTRRWRLAAGIALITLNISLGVLIFRRWKIKPALGH